MNRHPRRTFTLIELLVVVAIIAILAAMLLPALARARAAAMDSKGRSQLKQFGMAELMYAEEHDDTFHSTSYWWGWGGKYYGPGQPMEFVYPYLNQAGVKCEGIPSEPFLVCPIAESLGIKSMLGTAWWGSRSRNAYLPGRRLTRVVKPDRCIMWGCSTAIHGMYVWGGISAVGDFHRGGTFNAAFVDGHVTAVSKAREFLYPSGGNSAVGMLSINGIPDWSKIE